jgi:hypothetical protein
MPPAFFLLKIFAGVALWMVYTFYYTDRSNSDIWKYFDDSKVMYDAIHTHPSDYFKMLSGIGDGDSRIDMQYYHVMTHWYQKFDNLLLNDAHIIIRFNAFVRLFSMGNYFTHMLIMCFLAFIGLCWIYKFIFPFVKEWKFLPAGIIFLLPSVLFWSSGVMKEGLMLFGLGMLVYHSFHFPTNKKWKRITWMICGTILLFLTKFYVLAALIPSLPAAIWVMKKKGSAFLKFSIAIVICFFLGYSVRWINPIHDPLKLLSQKQNEFVRSTSGGIYLVNDSVVAVFDGDKRNDLIKQNDGIYKIKKGADYFYMEIYTNFKDTFYVKGSNDNSEYKILNDLPRAGSFMNSDLLQPTLSSFLFSTPLAFSHVLLRPYLWEGKNPMLLFPALENLFFIFLLLLAIFFRGKISSPEIFWFCLTFSLLLLLVMGLTTPVLGALVRYRIAAQPFLYFSVLMCIDREKLVKKWKWVEKIGI